MLDIPEEIIRLLDILKNFKDNKRAQELGYKLLFSIIKRYGFRWEYFV